MYTVCNLRNYTHDLRHQQNSWLRCACRERVKSLPQLIPRSPDKIKKTLEWNVCQSPRNITEMNSVKNFLEWLEFSLNLGIGFLQKLFHFCMIHFFSFSTLWTYHLGPYIWGLPPIVPLNNGFTCQVFVFHAITDHKPHFHDHVRKS